MDSLAIVEFSYSIKQFIETKKANGMPAEAIRLALAEILREVETTANQEVQKELAERAQKEAK